LWNHRVYARVLSNLLIISSKFTTLPRMTHNAVSCTKFSFKNSGTSLSRSNPGPHNLDLRTTHSGHHQGHNVSLREKLSHTEIYVSTSGRHHRCPVCFFLREKLAPWKFTVVTLFALLTRDLLAIAKFLVIAVLKKSSGSRVPDFHPHSASAVSFTLWTQGWLSVSALVQVTHVSWSSASDTAQCPPLDGLSSKETADLWRRACDRCEIATTRSIFGGAQRCD